MWLSLGNCINIATEFTGLFAVKYGLNIKMAFKVWNFAIEKLPGNVFWFLPAHCYAGNIAC